MLNKIIFLLPLFQPLHAQDFRSQAARGRTGRFGRHHPQEEGEGLDRAAGTHCQALRGEEEGRGGAAEAPRQDRVEEGGQDRAGQDPPGEGEAAHGSRKSE